MTDRNREWAQNPFIARLIEGAKRETAAEKDAVLRLQAGGPELLRMLTRLTEKVERANAIQHGGGYVCAEDWGELWDLTNEARALIARVEGRVR